MIRAEVIGDNALVANLRQSSLAAEKGVRDSIARLVLRLQRKVQTEKLTGQVLRVRTGTLRRSIEQIVVAEPDAVVGIVSTNVRYGRLHEYGYEGPVNVKGHLRTVVKAWGRTLKAPKKAQVSAHTRQVKFPARSFLRTSLREMQGAVEGELSKGISEAMRK